ncbi:MAG: autotransporter-associated beta strand repeat-containing protein [Verrucomicrobiae bacterium]|nr:autotransporter-associated beta strand repeat-containing protein [Verrucomicrobiae bacterium]
MPLFLAAFALTAGAAVDYWDGTGNLWGTASFWSTAAGATTPDPGTAPGAADKAIFNISTVNTAQTVYLGGNQAALAITNISSGTTTLLGGTAGSPAANVLTLGTTAFATNVLTANAGAGIMTIGDPSGGGANVTLTLAGATNFLMNAAAGTTLNLANGINFNSGKIQNVGAGTLILGAAGTGAGLPTVVGGVTYNIIARLDAGTVTLGNPGAFGTGVIDTRNYTLQASTDLTGANKIANTFVLPTGTTIIGGSTNLELGGQFIANATGGLTINNTAATTLSGNLYLSDVTGTGHTLTISVPTTAGTTTISGLIANYTGGTGTAGSLIRTSAGTLIISGANNTFSGGTTLGANATGTRVGVIRATANQALGTGSVLIGAGGNDATARLELAGGISLNNPISLPGRTATTDVSVGIENINGTNTLSGTVAPTSGGTEFHIQSDTNLLILGASGAAAISSAAGARTVSLQGAGNGSVIGNIVDGAGTSGIIKAGTGVWSFSGSNTYSIGTTITAGTLVMASTNALGTNSVTFSGTVNATLDVATDGGDYTNTIACGSGSIWTIASDVKTGSTGINHTFGNFLIGSGSPAMQANIVRGPNVTTGSPQISAVSMTLSGGSGGVTVLNPTTAALSIGPVIPTATSKTLQLDGTSTGNAITGAIADAGGFVITLVKTNTSTWTLSGPNTFSGSTTVAQGTLALGSGGSLASASLSVAAGATLDVTASSYALGATQTLSGGGTIAGNFADSTGSQIAPGGLGVIGNLTFNNNLTLAGGDTNLFDFSATSNDLIIINGSLTPNPGTVINLASLPPGGLANGTYTLMQVSGTLGGSPANFTITGKPSPSRQTFNIIYATSPNRVQLQVVGSPAALTWLGTPGSIWDIVTTANWTNATSHAVEQYFDGDNVSFTDIGSANQPTLNTTVQPGQVTFNSSVDYVLAGNGAISGNGGLVKSGTSTLTITTTNTYTGVTAFNGGKVSVNAITNGGVASPLGAAASASANRTYNGGTFQYTGDTASSDCGATLNAGGGTIEVANSATTLTLSGGIVGTSGGALTKTGNGTLALSGPNTYNGATILSAGALTVSGGNGIPDTSAVSVADAAGVVLTIGANETIGSLAGGGVNGGSTIINGMLTLGGNNASTGFGDPITGTGGLTKTGTGILTLTNSATLTGSLFVKAGAVVIDSGGSLSTSTYDSIGQDGTDNGTLTLKGSGSFSTTGDFNVGDIGSSMGTLNVQDSASLSVNAFFVGSANAAGVVVTGIVNQTGGTVSQNSSTLGSFVIGGRTSTNGVGIYNLVSGQLTATAPVRMSGNGKCVFNQSGGTFTAASTAGGINLQRFAGPGGTYNLDGGTFQAWNVAASILATDPTYHSVFNFNGGTLQPTADNTNNYFQGLSRANVRTNGAIIDTAGHNITISQPLVHSDIAGESAIDGGLTKQNSGTLTLAGTNTYTGSTVVNGGTLVITATSGTGATTVNNGGTVLTVAGVTGTGPITINGGATVNGNGVLNGLTTNVDGILSPGNAVGILTISNTLVLGNGSQELFNFTAGTNSTLTVSGGIVVNGSSTISLTFVGTTPPVGTTTLVRYGTTLTGFGNLIPPISSNPRFIFSLTNDTTAKAIKVIVTGVPSSLTWLGDGGYNGWDNAGSYQNWRHSGTNDYFYDGDSVTLNDTGNTAAPINIQGVVSPASMTVSNSAGHDYDFANSGGSISGLGGLVKLGAGKLTIEVNSTSVGATVISNGIVQVGTGGSSGSLGTGNVTNNTSLIFDRNDTITLPSPIYGSGSVSTIGTGVLAASGSNYYTGNTFINAGTTYMQNPASFGATNGTIYVDQTLSGNGAALYITANVDNGGNPLVLFGTGGGSGALRKGGAGVTTYNGDVALAGDTSIVVDGSATLNLAATSGINGSAANANLTLTGPGSGVISGPLALGAGGLTVSSGTWTLPPSNSFTGLTALNGGTTRVTGGSLGMPAAFTANQITLAGGTLEAVTNASFNDGNAGFTLTANSTLLVDSGFTLTISNQITGGNALTKASPGTLILTGNNPFNGTLNLDSFSTSANDGAVRITTSNAIINVPSPINSRNNNGGSSIFQLDGSAGAISVPQTISVACRNSGVAWVENIAGNNVLANTVLVNVGGSTLIFQSDAGQLEIANTIEYVGASTAGRTYNFTGTGNQLVSGVIPNGDNGANIGISKSGTGTVILSATNTYGGSTAVSAGLLLVNGSISSTNGIAVTGGTLGGTGAINDSVTVSSGGTLSPGASIGTLTINSNLTLAGTTYIEVNKTALISDHVTGLTSVTYGGTLFATNLSGTLTTNDSFTIFTTAAHSGNFASITGTPGVGKAWSFNPTTGVLSVIVGVNPNPTNITAVVNGPNLELSWPADHTGWRLQVETNSLATGLATNWVDVAGATSVNSVTNAINPANGTVFYRMVYP